MAISRVLIEVGSTEGGDGRFVVEFTHGRFRNGQHGSQQRTVAGRQGTTALDHLNPRGLPSRGRPLSGTEIALHAAGFDLAPLHLGVLGAVGELVRNTDVNGDVAFFGDVDHRGFLEVVLLRDVGDSEVGSLAWVVSDFSDVKAKTEVAHGDVVDVFGSLVERRTDFRGVAVRTVNAVVPIAEITRGRVEGGRLKVGVLGHVSHLLAVVAELVVVGAFAIGAVAPWPENEF